MTKEQRKFRLLTLAVSVAVALSLFAAIVYVLQLTLHPAATPLAMGRDGMAFVGDFALLDHEGKHHQLYRYVNSRAVVLFVYGSDCNIARDRIPALKQLRDQFATPDYGFLINLRERFANRSVSFLMIDANPQDDRKTLQKDVARYGVDLPILKDKTQLVADSLDIYRTGEALLIDARTLSGAPRA